MKTWKSLAMTSIAVAVVGSSAMSGCKRLTGGGATPNSEDDKTFYTLGMLLGRNLGTFNLTAAELELVKSGSHRHGPQERAPGRPRQVRPQGRRPRPQARTGAGGDREGARQGLSRPGGAEPGAVVTPSGMVFRTVTPGTGEAPQPTDRVSVQYEGRLTDGTVFDSTKKRGGVPADLPAQRRHQVLDRGGRADEGRREGRPDLPVGNRLRRQRPPAHHPGRRHARSSTSSWSHRAAEPDAPAWGCRCRWRSCRRRPRPGMPMQLHMGGPGGPQKMTLPPPSSEAGGVGHGK